jgi:hypothetical protein
LLNFFLCSSTLALKSFMVLFFHMRLPRCARNDSFHPNLIKPQIP